MIGGLLAANMGTGFLGGIVAGFIAGYGTDFMNRRPAARSCRDSSPC